MLGAADVNLLKVPEGMDDKKVVLLSDIMPTGWHGATLANVQKGDRVAVWGCGPGAPALPNRPKVPTLTMKSLSHFMPIGWYRVVRLVSRRAIAWLLWGCFSVCPTCYHTELLLGAHA